MFAPCINSIKALFIIPTDTHKEVPSSTVYRTLAHRLVCHHGIDHVINDQHNRTIIVVLAKHETAP